MAVIYWNQADGWTGPNTTDGDTDCGTWRACATTNGNIDTVAYTPTGAYAPKSGWEISGLSAINDKAQFQYSIPFAVASLSASAVFTLPSLNDCERYKQIELFKVGDASIRLNKRDSNATTTDLRLYLNKNQGSEQIASSVSLSPYAIGGASESAILIEADVDFTVTTGAITLRVYYDNAGTWTQIGDTFVSDAISTGKTFTALYCGGVVPTSKTGAIQSYQCFEFQIRDVAGHHVANPFIGYPAPPEDVDNPLASSVWKEEDFSTDGALTGSDAWENYSGTSGLLVRGSSSLAPSEAGTETCVLVDSPVIAQGHISVDIAGLQSGDKAGITLARHKSQFNVSNGGSEAVDASQYDIYVTTDGATHTLVVELDGTPLDSDDTLSSASGTLVVYCRESGVNNRIYATFDSKSVATDDIDTYPARWGLIMTRAAGAGATLSNWAATWQYPTTHTVYELARFCDGIKGNNMLHPCVIQSPKYNQTIIAAQVGPGAETDDESAIWAWIVPIDGMTSATDFLGPVKLDIGDGATYRAHNPSGGTHDGRAVIMWGRDDWPNFAYQALCGAIHQGDTNFVYADGNSPGDVGAEPRLSLVVALQGLRLHLKGQGFQHGENLIMPGIVTATAGPPASADTGIVTLTVGVSGGAFVFVTGEAHVSGGTVADTRGDGEWAIYPESDSAWWAWCRGTSPAPIVYKSTDQGATWVNQTDAFPLSYLRGTPIDGTVLGGGEFILHGPLQTQAAGGSAIRKQVTAIPISDSANYTQGWAFDRADEMLLLWGWTKNGHSEEGYMGYGQLVSTTAGDAMVSYTQRDSATGGIEKASQIFLIQIPQATTGYTPWENPYTVTGGVVSNFGTRVL